MDAEIDKMFQLLRRVPFAEANDLFAEKFRSTYFPFQSRTPEQEMVVQKKYADFLHSIGWDKTSFLQALDDSRTNKNRVR